MSRVLDEYPDTQDRPAWRSADRAYLLVSVTSTALWVLCVTDTRHELAAIGATLLPILSLFLAVVGASLFLRAWRTDRVTTGTLLAVVIALIPVFFLLAIVMFLGPGSGEDY